MIQLYSFGASGLWSYVNTLTSLPYLKDPKHQESPVCAIYIMSFIIRAMIAHDPD